MRGGDYLDDEGDENLQWGVQVRDLHLMKMMVRKFLEGADGGRWTKGTLKNKARRSSRDSKALRFF